MEANFKKEPKMLLFSFFVSRGHDLKKLILLNDYELIIYYLIMRQTIQDENKRWGG